MRKHTYAFYWFFKLFLLAPGLRAFFDRVYYVNSTNMVRKKAVLFAGNHPNSFLDGVVLAFFSIRRVWVVVRGDVFKHPVANRILRSLRLLPIFRARDANAKVAKRGNEQTEEEMLHLFKKKRAVLIFSEGSSYPEKKLRSLMRGTAKMMTELPDKMAHPDDLSLQTVGLNYDRFFTRGGQFTMVFGEPVMRKDLTDKQADNYTVAHLKRVNEQIRTTLSPLVVQWQEGAEEVQETVLRMISHDTNHGWKFIQRSDHYFKRVQHALLRWQNANDSVRTKADAYHTLLGKRLENDLRIKPLRITLRVFLALFLLVPSALGYAVYNPGWWLAWSITHHRIKDPIFIDSIYFGIGMFFGILTNLVVLIVSLTLVQNWMIAVGIFVGLKLCYYLYLVFRPEYRHLKERFFNSMQLDDEAEAKNLREELINYFTSE